MKEKEEKISKALMFVKTTSLTPYRIAQDTKITEATIGNYKNGKTKPTLANAEILIRYFEEINNLEIDISGLNKQTRDTNNDTRPRIPYDAAAGTLTDIVNGVAEYECEQVPIIGVFPKYDFTIRITGRSLEPEYYAGDEVACLKINEARFIQWGRVHVLDTTQGVVIKRIYDDGSCIRCSSYNTDFPDFSIPKDDIRSFNLVVGTVRL